MMTSGVSAAVTFGLVYIGPTLSASGASSANPGQPYSISLSATDPLHTISEWFIDWGDGTTRQGITGNPATASHSYLAGGHSYTIAASAMDDTGLYSATPLTVNVAPPLQVVSVTPNVSGASIRFNDVINAASIHLYDAVTAGHTTLLAPDVTLVGATTGVVTGSLVFDADLKGLTFIKTGAPLAADTYTLTLLSGSTGFQDSIGALDGKSTGVPGSGAYTTTFTVGKTAAAPLSMPDFLRSPGQAVNYAVSGVGVPITLPNAAGITGLTFHIDYDPKLLTITGAVSTGAPAGSTLTAVVSTPGHATFVFTAAAPLRPAAITLGAITATVAASAGYGTRHLLHLGT